MRTVGKRPMEGRTVGERYRIGRLLRHAASGDVYTCQDTIGENPGVAIRILHISKYNEKHEDLGRRMVLLQKLRHPQIENIFDFGVLSDTGGLFFVSAYAEGQDFYSGTENSEPMAILALFAEILHTLRYPHMRGMFHGNLAPESILLFERSEGRRAPLLRDFSLYRSGGGFDNREAICYAAPELLLEGSKGKETDFYALGVLLYQSLTRKLPFEDGDPDFLVQKQIQGNIDLGPVERLDGGENVMPLLERLLEKKPEKRIRSVDEALALLPPRICLDSDLPGEKSGQFSAAPFVGREEEMRLLLKRAGHVMESRRGWTVFIAGEAGSGKTRCMEELRGWALVNGWCIMECSFHAHEEFPYDPYRQILGKSDFFEEETGSFSEDASLVAEPSSSAFEFTSERFHDRLTRELVRRLSCRPTLLLLHDVHWASTDACTVLEYLCSDIRAHPVFVCASFRMSEISGDAVRRAVAGVRRGDRGELISLDPLSKDSVRQMIAGLTGWDENQEFLCNWMFRAVGGNPLYLEEMLEHLARHGVLRNHPGGWKFSTPLPTTPEVPAGIGAVLRKRLGQLSPTAMETLEWLSLFHRAVPRKHTKLLTGFNAATDEASIAELNDCNLLRVESSAGLELISIGHELIAETAREMIPQVRKQKMYRDIAELLEKEAGKDRQREAALHYTESPPDVRSVRCALTTVADFNAVFAHENALRCFEYAFKHKDMLTENELFPAMTAVCDSMFALGKTHQAIRLIHLILRSLAGIEPKMKAHLHLNLATAYRYTCDWRKHERSCHTGLRALQKSSYSERLAEAQLWTELAFGAIARSRAQDAFHYLDHAARLCTDEKSPALAGRIQTLYASLYCVVCEFKKAAEAGEKAITILGHSDEYVQKCVALSTLGFAYMKRGRYATVLRLHLRAVALSEKSRFVIQRSLASINLAECLCCMGLTQESLAAVRQAAAAAKESDNPAISRACNAVAAEINLAACNYEETCRLLKALECDEKQISSTFTIGHSLYVSAELNFSLGDFTNALGDIRKLRKMMTSETTLCEYEIAEALKERIVFERDKNPRAIRRLRMLKNRVAEKRWPYQRCLIKLHICEVLIELKKPDEAELYARKALRLAKGMQSASLQCRARLMLGISRSPLKRAFSVHTRLSADNTGDAISSLNACLGLADVSCSLECRWRALAELSFIYRYYRNYELCFRYARQAYETLVKLEAQTPGNMLDSFRGVFDRGRIKQELAQLIDGERIFRRETQTTGNSGIINTGILMRITAIVNLARELAPMIDELLGSVFSAIAVGRVLIFLWNDVTGKLELAGGRSGEDADRAFFDDVSAAVLDLVFRDGKPIVSADAGSDPRVMKNDFAYPPGKLLCIPLKTPERTIGVFYADCRKPVDNIGAAEIDLTEAFCKLAALAVDNITYRRKFAAVSAKSDFSGSTETPDPFPEIIGTGSATRRLKECIRLVAASPLDVLIAGESGSGKEMVARAVGGGRGRNGKFISVDCGALTDGVAEAELFGCRRGAFTGATEDRIGLFEAAAGGVVFLDEISNMPLRLQAKLLRTLQEREVRRIGETVPRKINVRVVAATNRELAEDIKNGHFRHDLYHRLKGMEIYVPSLRERADDIPLLVEYFLKKIFNQENGVIRRFSTEALGLLEQYSYPGNIRELKNIVESAYYRSSDHIIEIAALPQELRMRKTAGTAANSTVDNLYRGILAGEGGFNDLVKKPYLAHRFETSVVRGVIQRALSDSSGVYRNAFERLRIPESSYSATIQFLKRHNCYLDFQPFRRDCE